MADDDDEKNEEGLITLRNYAILNLTLANTSNKLNRSLVMFDSGLYGNISPKKKVYGQVVPVTSVKNNNYQPQFGCDDYTQKSLPKDYVAFVSRGGCTFAQKVKTALRNKASAIIIYNNQNDLFTMDSSN